MFLTKNISANFKKKKFIMNEKEASDFLKSRGYGLVHPSEHLIDIDKNFIDIWNKVSDFTMISIERGYSVFKSIEYIISNNIKGEIAECGVWKGGCCMLSALSLLYFGSTDRKYICMIHLRYD